MTEMGDGCQSLICGFGPFLCAMLVIDHFIVVFVPISSKH